MPLKFDRISLEKGKVEFVGLDDDLLTTKTTTYNKIVERVSMRLDGLNRGSGRRSLGSTWCIVGIYLVCLLLVQGMNAQQWKLTQGQ